MTDDTDDMTPEFDELSDNIVRRHKPMAVDLATMLQVAKSLFGHAGRQQGVTLDPLLALMRKCVDHYALAQGLSKIEMDCTIEALQRASRTAEHLTVIAQNEPVPVPDVAGEEWAAAAASSALTKAMGR